MEKGVNLFAQRMDNCPKNDQIIEHDSCGDCKYYRGFELYEKAVPSVRCGYYTDIVDDPEAE